MAQRGKFHQVLVTDDQLLFRSGLRTLLAGENDLRIAAEASTIAEALTLEPSVMPDVALVSSLLLSLASSNQRRQVRSWSDRAALVLVADSRGTGIIDLAAEMGSVVLLPRSTPPVQIVRTLWRAARGDEQSDIVSSPSAAGLRALAGVHSARGSVLTCREQEVVKLLAEGRTVRETAEELSLSAKTIEAHKLNVMRKLDIHNRRNLIEYAISNNIVTPLAV